MGKYFTAVMPDGSERYACDYGNEGAAIFLENVVRVEAAMAERAGITLGDSTDDYVIDASRFLPFFERFWNEGWLDRIPVPHLRYWAGLAAGILENITLHPRVWLDANGEPLQQYRYSRPEESESYLACLERFRESS